MKSSVCRNACAQPLYHLLDFRYYYYYVHRAVTTATDEVLHNACLGNLINTHNSRNIQTKTVFIESLCEHFIHSGSTRITKLLFKSYQI